jgi:hypothetical protein
MRRHSSPWWRTSRRSNPWWQTGRRRRFLNLNPIRRLSRVHRQRGSLPRHQLRRKPKQRRRTWIMDLLQCRQPHPQKLRLTIGQLTRSHRRNRPTRTFQRNPTRRGARPIAPNAVPRLRIPRSTLRRNPKSLQLRRILRIQRSLELKSHRQSRSTAVLRLSVCRERYRRSQRRGRAELCGPV